MIVIHGSILIGSILFNRNQLKFKIIYLYMYYILFNISVFYHSSSYPIPPFLDEFNNFITHPIIQTLF